MKPKPGVAKTGAYSPRVQGTPLKEVTEGTGRWDACSVNKTGSEKVATQEPPR